MKLEYDAPNPIDGEITVLIETETYQDQEYPIHICTKHGLLSHGSITIPDLDMRPNYFQRKKISADGKVWFPFYSCSPDGKISIEITHDDRWLVQSPGDASRTFKKFEPAFDFFNNILNEYYLLIEQIGEEE